MKTNLLIAVLSVLVSGCVDVTDDVVDDGADVTNVARVTSNALTPTQLWNSNFVSGPLTTTNLGTMAATADGRAGLQYAIACALTTQQQVWVTVGGTTYNYKGKLGIAGTWTTTALSDADQKWVTACVLSLTNLTGANVTLSVRGGSLGLEANETTTYSVEEGAFWGNLFLGEASYASACNGVDQAARDVGGSLPLRECAEDDAGTPGTTPCGFTYAGLCTDVCASSGWYAGCSDGVHTTNSVVSAYLTP